MSNQNQKRGRRNNSGGGRRGGGNPARQNFDSNGPGVRIRGNASQIQDKYLQLARDAQSSGDRVLAENMLQHAEHYYRILNADSGERGGRPDQQRGQPQAPNASELTQREDQDDDAGNRDAGNRDTDQRDGPSDRGERGNGGGGNNGNGGNNGRGRGRGRGSRNRQDDDADGNRDGNRDDNRDGNRDDRAAADETVGNDRAEESAGTDEAAPPKRGRGRPRKNPDAAPRKRKPANNGEGSSDGPSDDADDAGVRAIIGAD